MSQDAAEIIQFPVREREQQLKWEVVVDFLEENFSGPDLEGLRIVAAAALAHHLWPKANPVWLMVVGASGSGKSALVTPTVQAFPCYHSLDTITPATFLSGWAPSGSGNKKGEDDSSLLTKLGPSIIFGISDFSTVVGLKNENRREVQSQMRRLYDGEMTRHAGIDGGIVRQWQGKATMVVGATAEIARQWSLEAALGERFLQLNWRRGPLEEIAGLASQHDREAELKQEMTKLVGAWAWPGTLEQARARACYGAADDMKMLGISELASLTARLRTAVVRDRSALGTNTIIETAEAEGPMRIATAIYQLARAHASLFGRVKLTREDMAIARRMARDSIPMRRLQILDALDRAEKPLGLVELKLLLDELDAGRLPITTIQYYLDELVSLRLVDQSARSVGGLAVYEPGRELRDRIGLLRAIIREPAEPQEVESSETQQQQQP